MLALCAALTPVAASAKHAHPEAYYQKKWCAEHRGEVVTISGKEIDCLTNTHAVEVEFAGFKCYEAVGQALRYMRLSRSERAGIVFIVSPRTMRFVDETVKDIRYHQLPVDIWTVEE